MQHCLNDKRFSGDMVFLVPTSLFLQDSTFEFERKRNRPERYDRNVTENTLKAIKTIDKVRSRREAKHIERR